MASGGKRRRKAAPRARRIPLAGDASPVARLRRELAASRQRERESRAREAATAAILKVIRRSPDDVQPVFDAIVRSAQRLFRVPNVNVVRLVDDVLHLVAHSEGTKAGDAALRKLYPAKLTGRGVTGKAVVTGKPNWIADVETDPGYSSGLLRAGARARGWRSLLVVPMMREGKAIGTINIARPEPGEFSAHQIALLQTFADQAVIAIENVRLFNETKDALERQTATAEILKVIAGSSTEAQSVFDAIVRSGLRLFAGMSVAISLMQRDELRVVAADGEFGAMPIGYLVPLTRDSATGLAVSERRTVTIPDTEAADVSQHTRDNSGKVGFRAVAAVPMLREGEAIGCISVLQKDAGGLTEHQLDLLRSYADQAVIAIENARLFNETKESLERQTATAEVLSVISNSIADAKPVFEKIVQSCERLFVGSKVGLNVIGEDGLVYAGAYGTFDGAEKFRSENFPHPATAESATGAAILQRRVVHYPDVFGDPQVPQYAKRGCEKMGTRSAIIAPLLTEDRGLGAIFVGHEVVRPFSDKEQALLKSFADQAVIAIQNARLFNETREALERQTATAEILKVIARSPSDLRPVFDVILSNATRLCGAQLGILNRYDGKTFQTGAQCGGNPKFVKWLFERGPWSASPSSVIGRMISERRPLQVLDLRETQGYRDGNPITSKVVDVGGARTFLTVPLLKDDQVIGNLGIYRTEVRAFSERQVELVRTFADQAVIAIENVRLFNETKESLERQTATAEILKVIASSPSDVQPVFDTIAGSALHLIGGSSASVLQLRDGILHLAALTSASKAGDEALRALFPAPVSERPLFKVSLDTGAPFVRADTEADPMAKARELARTRGYRSQLVVPMLRNGVVVGFIVVARKEPGTFSEHQIGLLQTFADQAVIAIENVRLFNETKESLERQTATAEILSAMSASMADTKPVFDAIVRSCSSLFEGSSVSLRLLRGDGLHLEANIGYDAGTVLPLDRESVAGVCVLDGRTVHLPDLEAAAPEYPRIRQLGLKFGYRSGIYAPLMRGGAAIGIIAVLRPTLGAFTEKEVALLGTFTNQAVIAIENVRLFNETRESLERQTATAEILRVISGSPTDTRPVFDAITQIAARLLEPASVALHLLDGELIQLGAFCGPLSADRGRDIGAKFYPIQFNPKLSLASRAIAEAQVIELPDLEAPDTPAIVAEQGRSVGFKSVTHVPLLREGKAIGTLAIAHPQRGYRLEPRKLEVMKTFADQAVIAIENVRLFNETKEALERQTATAEILKVIASSPSDVQPVFDAIAASARRLLGGQQAVVTRRVADTLHLVAFTPTTEAGDDALEKLFPTQIRGQGITGQAIVSRGPVSIEDIEADAAYSASFKDGARARGFRSVLSVPMLREGEAIGAINVTRPVHGPFSEHQVNLLKAFADQAVIAIENVRLFNETKEALEQQTATAEILKVISESPTDTQPVFDAIVQAGLRLFPEATVLMTIPVGAQVRAVAVAHEDPAVSAETWKRFPLPLTRDRLHSAAILDGTFIDLPDAETEKEGRYAPGVSNFLASGNRAITIAPLICGDAAIGAISVSRIKPGALSEKQVALLRTFAAQAVIAIENVRIFKELEARTGALTRSVGQLTALGEVGRAISSTLDLETVLRTIVSRAVQLSGLDGGTIYEYDEASEEFHLRAAENLSDEVVEMLRSTPMKKGEGPVGHAVETGEPTEIAEMLDDSYQSPRRDSLIRAGYRALLVVPLVREDHIIGALAVNRKAPGAFSHEVVELLKTFATQSAMAIQNARLFREIADKGKQLEVASRHKSDFLASMSHELRTPLNAILGFNEMILGQVYGEVPVDMKEPLEDIQKSGRHLLRLINNVLDLAKIEAGRMELSLADYSVQDTVESVRATLRPLAAEKGLEFLATVPNDLPLAYGDGGRITQCLMNLAGNSLKFTKAGRVEISVAAKGENLLYKVADTGIGIPPDKIASLFTEFKQTDAAIASEYGGTGLGLSISKKFVEMHGGRIWVESELGKGSAFIFEVPLRVNS